MNVKSMINYALEQKRVITFIYKRKKRIVEPYHYGTHLKNKHLFLLAYQLAGEANGEQVVGWKTFALDEIKHLQLSLDHFVSRADYNPTDIRWLINKQIRDHN